MQLTKYLEEPLGSTETGLGTTVVENGVKICLSAALRQTLFNMQTVILNTNKP